MVGGGSWDTKEILGHATNGTYRTYMTYRTRVGLIYPIGPIGSVAQHEPLFGYLNEVPDGTNSEPSQGVRCDRRATLRTRTDSFFPLEFSKPRCGVRPE
jgi:hypothetical protein